MNKKLIIGIIGIIILSIFIWYGFTNPKLHAKLLNLMAALTNSAPASQSASNTSDNSSSADSSGDKTGLDLVQTGKSGSSESGNNTTTQQILDALKNNTIIAQGLDVDTGTITASNVIYSVKAGDGVSVSKGQYPTITNTGVLSIGGKAGVIYLDEINGGIKFDNMKLYNADKGSSQNIFKTIAVSDKEGIKADSNNTTLHIEAGTGIEIDTNDTEKRLRIESKAGWNDDGTVVRLVDPTDKVGIGTSNPTSLLSVGTASGFQVDASGNLVKLNNVAYSFPSSQGSTSSILQNDGTGGLTWASLGAASITADSLDFTEFKDAMTLDASTTIANAGYTFSITGAGATNITSLSANGPVYTSGGNGTLNSEAQLSIARGGTGIGTTPVNGQILIGNGGSYNLATLTGTANQISVANGGGSITLSTPQNIHTSATPTFSALNLSSSSNQLVLNSSGITGTLSWTPTSSNKTVTIPDATGTICLTTGNCTSSSAGVGGSGTSNYLSKFNGQYTLGNSLLYDTGTNIGIGTTLPSSLFSVGTTSQFQVNSSGAIAAATGITSSGTITLSGLGSGLVKSTSGVLSNATVGTDYQGVLSFSNGLTNTSNTVTLGGTLTQNTTLANDGFNFNITGSGNVGIGTTAPGAKFDVSTIGVFDSQSTTIGGSSGLASERLRLFYNGTLARARLTGLSGVSLGFGTNGTDDQVVINTSGNVGIGTTAPHYDLEVGTMSGGQIDIRNINTSSTAVTLNSVLGTLSFSGTDSAPDTSARTATAIKGLGGASWTATASTHKGILAFYTQDDSSVGLLERMRINNAGNVGIGTTSPAFKLEVNGNIGPSVDSSGSGVGYNIGSASKRYDTVYASNGTINTSDQRLKTNITNLNYGLDALMQLQPVSFNWTSNPQSATKLGLIAQQVQKIIPEVVKVGDDPDHTLGIYYSDLIPVTIKGIQEQQGKIQELGLQLTSLDKTVKTINGVSSDFTADKMQEATISGALTVGILTVKGDSIFEKTVTFMGEVIHKATVSFQGTVSFFAKVVFHSDVDLNGKTAIADATVKKITVDNIAFNKNTVGTAIVKKGSRSVIVTFDKEYNQIPSINININLKKTDDQAKQDALDEQILQNDIKYIVTDIATKGFVIKLNKNAPEDISFSWTALSGVDTKTSESQENTVTPTSAPTDVPSPTEPLSPTATLVPSPTNAIISPSPTSVPTISITPTVSPIPTP